MGLTIHYSLQSEAASRTAARRQIEQLRQRASELPMQHVGEVVELGGEDCNLDGCDDPELRWLLVQAGQIVRRDDRYLRVEPRQVIAFTALPGEGCEAANFGLCRYPGTIEFEGRRIRTGLRGWSWESFCKTQYASNSECGGMENFLRCHLAVIGILDEAAKLGILGDVRDEGGFWEKRSMEDLASEVAEWNVGLAAFVGELKDSLGGDFVAEITKFPDFERLEAKGRISKE
jgi:hypothetical protein